MRCDTAQIVPVAPWFDITNSHGSYWIRNHRWKNPEYFPEYHTDLFPRLANLDAIPGRNVMQREASEANLRHAGFL